ncbi:aspartate/glutamate racemase family protein [Streptomyces sp. 110]|uniref:Aspartate/glutamate racemase family protein n=1 Tax=Streptomyces endocoffeicus TaxID=2898945 RepID=A0ABS1Q652_9ACTN|nr:aspartate/glutamate racemase family protein [Streptomyces endocoffeicus]MBL1120139.1 aspartate/glutamate racemase family protein [Streptomyces endocoffeicus]
MTIETTDTDQNEPTWSEDPYSVDEGVGWRAHIGMVIYSNDQTLPHEGRVMLNFPGVALFESRIHAYRGTNQPLTAEGLSNTSGIEGAARLINTMRPSDVVAIGCTSAAMVIGNDELHRLVRRIHPNAQVTDPFTGIKAALTATEAKRVGFISPYPRDVAERMTNGFQEAGFEIPVATTFKNPTGFVSDDAPFITPDSMAAATRRLINETELDTVVIACTQMRAAEMIEALEEETGKTIISSNQALCWHALRLAGCDDKIDGWGRLFRS